MNKYKFLIGIFEPRQKCTVLAEDLDDAKLKVRSEMDRRYEKSGREAPVGWDLQLSEVNGFDVLSYVNKIFSNISVSSDYLLTNIKDKHGNEIRTGDRLSYCPEEWGDNTTNEFIVYYKDGELQGNGASSEWSKYCEIVQ